MTLKLPDGLSCYYCGSRTLRAGQPRSRADYYWRYMTCKKCNERTWWGEPVMLVNNKVIADTSRPHMLLLHVPRQDERGYTANLSDAVPIGSSKHGMNKQAVELRRTVDLFLLETESENNKEGVRRFGIAVAKVLNACVEEYNNKEAQDDAAE